MLKSAYMHLYRGWRVVRCFGLVTKWCKGEKKGRCEGGGEAPRQFSRWSPLFGRACQPREKKCQAAQWLNFAGELGHMCVFSAARRPLTCMADALKRYLILLADLDLACGTGISTYTARRIQEVPGRPLVCTLMHTIYTDTDVS